jgi:putative transposase
VPKRCLGGTAGHAFHVLNRSARRIRLFESDVDYEAFMTCLERTLTKVAVRLFAYCVMPNHFHLVLSPTEDRQIERFMHYLTATHALRWHRHRGTRGTGCVYQGRYRIFAVRTDEHFLRLCRYVERNALRAGLVARSEDWKWSSAWRGGRKFNGDHLAEWPFPQPSNW